MFPHSLLHTVYKLFWTNFLLKGIKRTNINQMKLFAMNILHEIQFDKICRNPVLCLLSFVFFFLFFDLNKKKNEKKK